MLTWFPWGLEYDCTLNYKSVFTGDLHMILISILAWVYDRILYTFNTDFELYSTLNDAIAGRGRWRYCNFNDPGIGFPRDCGIERGLGYQWQSKRRGGRTTWKIYVYDNRSSFLNANLKNPFFGTVKGYEADPKCAYQNIPKPNNVFNRKINWRRLAMNELVIETAISVNNLMLRLITHNRW